MRKFKGNLNKWKDIPCLWSGRPNIIYMAVLYKLIYRFNTILIKIPAGILQKLTS